MSLSIIGSKLFEDTNVNSDKVKLFYHQSQLYNPDKYYYTANSNYEEYILKYDSDHEDGLDEYVDNVSKLGPYEKTLLRKMIFPDSLYINVIIGAIGSGKSTSLEYVSNFYFKNLKDKYRGRIVRPIKVDLNKVGSSDEYSGNEQEYFNEIFDLISDEIEFTFDKKYRKKEFIDFWIKAIDYCMTESEHVYVYKISKRIGEVSFKDFEPSFQFQIDQLTSEKRFKFWLGLLTIESALSNFDNSRSNLIIIDNIDQHASFIQNQLMNKLNRLCSETYNIQLFIAMRVISLGNLWGDIKKFNVIPNCSVLPIDIFRMRVNNLIVRLKNARQTNLWSFKKLTDLQMAAIFIYLLEISYLSKKKDSKFNNSVKSLSGFSIRRVLKLGKFIFDQSRTDDFRLSSLSFFLRNNVDLSIVLDDMNSVDSENIEEYASVYYKKIRDLDRDGVSVSDKDVFNTNLCFFKSYFSNENDKIIENVLSNGTSSISTIKLRILWFLSGNNMVELKLLINHLTLFSYTIDDILIAINSLSTQNRRLIYFDGPVEFSNTAMLSSYSMNKVILTNSGTGYIKRTIYIPDYLQYCFLELFPNEGNSMTGIEKLESTTRNILDLFRNDINEIMEYSEGFFKTSDWIKKYGQFLTIEYLHNYFIVGILGSLKKGFNNSDSHVKSEIISDLKSFFIAYGEKIDLLVDKRPIKFIIMQKEFDKYVKNAS